MRALEKADTPSDPVEQTMRAAAPAPPSYWPVHRDAARVRAREVCSNACGSGTEGLQRRMRGFPIVDSFQGQWS